ncbi:hypothetical protein Cgig2_023869 [Carnegiea gigantea]|uniref:Uncharacterized protein n=1 Tax=Carnegiea gigantea TaxID=171969 RepID=A0A9Q1GK03_9CARY|nr:hypothetical protein Cgig2_023869 [Carnegiea gigantea]
MRTRKRGEEEAHIQEAPKAVLKMKKPALKSKEEKTSSSGQVVQMAPQEHPLKYEKGGNEKRMYQKAFVTRTSISSFSSMVAQLNEAQIETVRSMRFASFFLKVDPKQIPGKFIYLFIYSKWLIESFDPHFASFVLPDREMFLITPFDVYVTLGVPFGGRQIMESNRSSTDEEYDENRYYTKLILKYIKDVNQIASLDRCKSVVQKLITSVRQYKESKFAKGEEQALKSEEGTNTERTYQKAFITRMSTRSFSSLVAQLNEA